jgi:hypothetical protein
MLLRFDQSLRIYGDGKGTSRPHDGRDDSKVESPLEGASCMNWLFRREEGR